MPFKRHFEQFYAPNLKETVQGWPIPVPTWLIWGSSMRVWCELTRLASSQRNRKLLGWVRVETDVRMLLYRCFRQKNNLITWFTMLEFVWYVSFNSGLSTVSNNMAFLPNISKLCPKIKTKNKVQKLLWAYWLLTRLSALQIKILCIGIYRKQKLLNPSPQRIYRDNHSDISLTGFPKRPPLTNARQNKRPSSNAKLQQLLSIVNTNNIIVVIKKKS